MWNYIRDEKDVVYLFDLYGNFHDSCIKEFKYISGAFVSEDLSMQPCNNKRNLKIIFQRQYKNPSVIEIEFLGLKQLILFPLDENYTSEISTATMIYNDSDILWYDNDKLSKDAISNYKGILICSSKVRWRTAEEYIGQKNIYGSMYNVNE